MPRDPQLNEVLRVVMELAEVAPAKARANNYRWLASVCGDESAARQFLQLASRLESADEDHHQLYFAMGLGASTTPPGGSDAR